jgi:phosphoglycolate phosphatase-like HAD superfamily hydrolase
VVRIFLLLSLRQYIEIGANKGGKLEVIKRIKQQKNKNKSFDKNLKTIMVGDGASDLETKQAGGADIFVAFTETVHRDRIASQADFVCRNMLELLDILKKS